MLVSLKFTFPLSLLFSTFLSLAPELGNIKLGGFKMAFFF